MMRLKRISNHASVGYAEPILVRAIGLAEKLEDDAAALLEALLERAGAQGQALSHREAGQVVPLLESALKTISSLEGLLALAEGQTARKSAE